MEKFYLQSFDIVTPFRNILGGTPSEILGGIAIFLVFGIIIAATIFGGIIIYRAIMTYKAFGTGVPLGRFRFSNMADGKTLLGYLSKSSMFHVREDLQEWKDIEELAPIGERITKLLEEESLNLYDFNIFDYGNALRGKARRVRIICKEKIELDNISWIDQTGSRTWRSILNKEYIRNFWGYSNTEYHEVKNPDGNYDGYYLLAPVPRVNVGKEGMIISQIAAPSIKQIMIKPEILGDGVSLAKAASFIELIAEGHRKIKTATTHTAKLQDLLAKEQQINLALKMKVNKLRRILIQQLLIGYAKQQTPLQQVNTYAWLIGGCIATLFGALVVPNMDGIKETNIPNWLVGGAAMFTVIIIKYVLEQKQKPLDKSDVDERPENTEMIE